MADENFTYPQAEIVAEEMRELSEKSNRATSVTPRRSKTIFFFTILFVLVVGGGIVGYFYLPNILGGHAARLTSGFQNFFLAPAHHYSLIAEGVFELPPYDAAPFRFRMSGHMTQDGSGITTNGALRFEQLTIPAISSIVARDFTVNTRRFAENLFVSFDDDVFELSQPLQFDGMDLVDRWFEVDSHYIFDSYGGSLNPTAIAIRFLLEPSELRRAFANMVVVEHVQTLDREMLGGKETFRYRVRVHPSAAANTLSDYLGASQSDIALESVEADARAARFLNTLEFSDVHVWIDAQNDELVQIAAAGTVHDAFSTLRFSVTTRFDRALDVPQADVPVPVDSFQTLLGIILSLDSDDDGLTDDAEALLGTDYLNPDTDGDGYLDGEEVDSGYNPLGPGRQP